MWGRAIEEILQLIYLGSCQRRHLKAILPFRHSQNMFSIKATIMCWSHQETD